MKRITVGMHEAKTTLSQLVRKAAAGQEVVLSKNGEPVAKIVRYSGHTGPRKPGRLAGQIEIKRGFDELPPGFEVFAE
ncbi:MAG: type II toxin-antitoxin system Phd/YefM family antitoxin [Gaiellaceae bacterium]